MVTPHTGYGEWDQSSLEGNGEPTEAKKTQEEPLDAHNREGLSISGSKESE